MLSTKKMSIDEMQDGHNEEVVADLSDRNTSRAAAIYPHLQANYQTSHKKSECICTFSTMGSNCRQKNFLTNLFEHHHTPRSSKTHSHDRSYVLSEKSTEAVEARARKHKCLHFS